MKEAILVTIDIEASRIIDSDRLVLKLNRAMGAEVPRN